MFSRTVSVVAAAAASPSRPTSWTKTWNTSTSRNTCAPAGPPYFIKPAEQLSLRAASRAECRIPCGTCAGAGARARPEADVHDPATVAQPAPAIPSSGKPARPKISTRASATLSAGSGGLDAEHGPGLAAAGEEAVDRGHDQHRQGRKAEAAQIRHLQDLQGRGVPADGDQVRGGRDHEQEQEPGEHGEVDPLPDRRPDPLRTPGAGVLGDERRHIAGRHLEQPERQPVPHHGRKRRGHFPRVVPGEQDRVHEDLDGHEALADDQRQGQREQLPASALSRGAASRPRVSFLELAGGFEGGVFSNRNGRHLACLLVGSRSENTPIDDTWAGERVRSAADRRNSIA